MSLIMVVTVISVVRGQCQQGLGCKFLCHAFSTCIVVFISGIVNNENEFLLLTWILCDRGK